MDTSVETPAGGSEPEVLAKAQRRRFTVEYKRRIVKEAERCLRPGEIGALLRREGLDASALTAWRAARERGEIAGLASKPRGPRARRVDPRERKLAAQERELTQWRGPCPAGRGVGGDPKKILRDGGHPLLGQWREALMRLVAERGKALGVATLCAAVGIPRTSFYRRQQPRAIPAQVRTSPRALTSPERQRVLALLHAPRFVDLAPAEVYATLLDEGQYVCSERTMYRILSESQEVRERRHQLRHPPHAAPELLAERPNEVWSWDITKLLGPAKWTYFSLYVILDIFSRYVVGWMVAYRESAVLAQRLIEETCARQGILPGQLTVPADRGSSMIAKPVALLLADLGVVKTHSRPHVSNDNPFSEAQFKTLKYRPDFPERFGSLQDARAFSVDFFRWYNTEHHHTGIGLLTPHDLHHGLAAGRVHRRAATLTAAYAAHPERFPRGIPHPPTVPTAAWIDKPMPGPSTRVEAVWYCK